MKNIQVPREIQLKKIIHSVKLVSTLPFENHQRRYKENFAINSGLRSQPSRGISLQTNQILGQDFRVNNCARRSSEPSVNIGVNGKNMDLTVIRGARHGGRRMIQMLIAMKLQYRSGINNV